jgi:hypothetical protein
MNRHQRRKAKKVPMNNDFWGDTPPTREEFLEWLNNVALPTWEAKGIYEKVRDAAGNVVMKPDSKGVPQIVWRKIAAPEEIPSTMTEH